MRSEELVRGADEEVRAQCGHVDEGVGGEVDAVDVHHSAGSVGGVGNFANSGHRADQVGRGGNSDQAGAFAQQRLDRLDRELPRGRIEVCPPDSRADRLCGVHPGPDVGVVVESGDDHLVTRPPGLGHRAREVKGQLGHAAAEDDAVGLGKEEVADRLPRLYHDVVGAALGAGQPSPVRDRRP